MSDFSSLVYGLGGSYVCDKSGVIYRKKVSGVGFDFYDDFVYVKKDEKCKIKYDSFSSVTFSEGLNIDDLTHDILVSGKKIGTIRTPDMAELKSILEKLKAAFLDAEECTPHNEVESICSSSGIQWSQSYEPTLYKMVYVYKNKLTSMINNGFILEGDRLVDLLEENSAKLTENLLGTAKKNISLSNLSLGGFAKTAFNIGKVGLQKKVMGEISGRSNIMLLTTSGVLISTDNEIYTVEFDDFSDVFTSRDDETFADCVDVYREETGDKVLDNVDANLFRNFKFQVKNVKKIIGELENEADILANAENNLEQKLEYFKNQMDRGLISQKDFEKQRKILLKEYNQKTKYQKKAKTSSKNLWTNSIQIETGGVSIKSRLLMLILFFIPITSVPSAYAFYAGKISYGIFKCLILIVSVLFAILTESEYVTVTEYLIFFWLALHALDLLRILFGKFKDKNNNYISTWL